MKKSMLVFLIAGKQRLQPQSLICLVKLTRLLRLSGTVINSNPSNNQIWVKTDAGDEKQISDYGIPFRSSHTIYKYELRQYSEDGSYNVYKDALIVNKNTGEHEVNLNRKKVVIPAF